MEKRQEDAWVAASDHALAPESSALMYGIIGVALFSVGAWGAVRFYDQPLLMHWPSLASGALVAFGLGIWLRKRRKRRSINAHQAELIRQEAKSGS